MMKLNNKAIFNLSKEKEASGSVEEMMREEDILPLDEDVLEERKANGSVEKMMLEEDTISWNEDVLKEKEANGSVEKTMLEEDTVSWNEDVLEEKEAYGSVEKMMLEEDAVSRNEDVLKEISNSWPDKDTIKSTSVRSHHIPTSQTREAGTEPGYIPPHTKLFTNFRSPSSIGDSDGKKKIPSRFLLLPRNLWT